MANMEFNEIKKALEKKQEIIYNSIEHVEFQIDKYTKDLELLKKDYVNMDKILENISKLSNLAE